MSFKITGLNTQQKLAMNSKMGRRQFLGQFPLALFGLGASLATTRKAEAQAQPQESTMTPAEFCQLNKSAYEQVNAARKYWLKVYDSFEKQAHNEATREIYGREFEKPNYPNSQNEHAGLKKQAQLRFTLDYLTELKNSGDTAAEKALNFGTRKDDTSFLNLYITECNKAGKKMEYPTRYYY